MPIPAGLQRQHILDAIEDLRPMLDEMRAGPHHAQGFHLIAEDGTRFPPKYVISRALGFMEGTDLPFAEFSGGQAPGQANYVLRN